MKRGTPDHPKTHVLAAALDVELWGAVGILECLWHFTARYAPRGDIGRWPDSRIAAFVGWEGDPTLLVSTLTRSGWLDAHPDFRIVVHDWHDHADETTKKYLKRNRLGFLSRIKRVRTKSGPVETSPDMSGLPLPLPEPETEPEPRHAGPEPAAAGGPRANPLVGGRRDDLEREALRLCREIAALTNEDGETVMARASHWRGSRKLNPADMTDDRLLNTVIDLRAEAARLKGEPPPETEKAERPPPPPSDRATAREHAAMAGIQGGKTPTTSLILEGMRRDRPRLGRGDGAPGGEPARPGPDTEHDGDPGRDAPGGSEPPDR